MHGMLLENYLSLCFKSAANALGLRSKLDPNNLIKNGALGSTLAGFYLVHCRPFWHGRGAVKPRDE